MKHLTSLRYIDEVARTGSIRKAAVALAITSTALNRRILSMEEELGTQIFERLPHGVRLNTAGELLIHHIRQQISDMERVKSQIADLSGVRRGHVSIVCGQALLPYFLPQEISGYRMKHPGVTFDTSVCNREDAEQALASYDADIALIFEPLQQIEFHPIAVIEQPVHAIMSASHPLAMRKTLRLSDILSHPLALSTRANGVRHLLETATQRGNGSLVPTIESDSFDFLRNYVVNEQCLTFQIPIGLPHQFDHPELISRPMNSRDVPVGKLCLGQLRNRTLPVAAGLFANNLVKALEAHKSNQH